MTTSEPTDQNPIQHELSLGVSHVKTSQIAAEAKASRRLQGLVCSTTSCESYAWFDQTSLSWKTWQRSLITDWTPYLESFTRQGLMQNGQLFQQQWLELPTNVIDGGLSDILPTPLASTIDRRAKFKQGGTPLLGALLPTPRASEWKGVGKKGSKSSLKWNKQGYLSGVMNETCSPTNGEATHLNPSWVEVLMGYEIGFTDLGA